MFQTCRKLITTGLQFILLREIENRQGILQRYLRHCVCTCSFYITMRKCFGLPNLNISLKIAIIYFTAIVLASRILINECEKKRKGKKMNEPM